MEEEYEKKLPKIDNITDKYPNKVFFIVFTFFYLIYYCGIVKYIINKLELFKNITYRTSAIISLSIMGIMFVGVIIIFRQRLKRDFKLLVKNFGAYFKYNIHVFLRYFWIYLICCIVIGMTLYGMGKDVSSTNETNLEQNPIWLIAILGVFVAPILEEGMFRWIIRKITNNKWLYIFLSGFVFGLVHVNYWGEQDWIQLIHIFQYGILGMMLAESYYKTNNLLASSLLHGTWNSLIIILSLILTPYLSQ